MHGKVSFASPEKHQVAVLLRVNDKIHGYLHRHQRTNIGGENEIRELQGKHNCTYSQQGGLAS